ncbi:hypothetical protein ACFQ0X_41380 [Streptomyces rectiviolaceus]
MKQPGQLDEPGHLAEPLGARVGDPRADAAGSCGTFPSLGEIGLLIAATAARNLVLTGRRTAERHRGRHANGAAAAAPAPRRH